MGKKMCCNAFKPLNPHDPFCFFSFSRPFLPLRQTGLGRERRRTFARTSRSCTEGIEGIVSLVGWGSRFRHSNGLAFFFSWLFKKICKNAGMTFPKYYMVEKEKSPWKETVFLVREIFRVCRVSIIVFSPFCFFKWVKKKRSSPRNASWYKS